MRTKNLVFTLAPAVGLLFSGCSSSQSPNAIVPSSAAADSALRSPAVTPGALRSAHAKKRRDLYVADFGTDAVEILQNKSYRDVGVITDGISGPRDAFLDNRGNLYIANFSSSSVAEYAPGTGAPSFVYSNGMSEPAAVTTDAHGNVFEADFAAGTVNEYFQGLNEVVASCSVGYELYGVAVDSSGDVFIEYFSEPAHLAEYPGGLKNCNEQVLSVALPYGGTSPGGIALDKNNNILAADGSEVAVIDPPYTSIAGTIGSGFSGAMNVRLNKRNTEAFVTDPTNHTATVVSYPGGSNVTVLSTQNGLSEPFAAVDWPNAVY